jgi:hypothetical protein
MVTAKNEGSLAVSYSWKFFSNNQNTEAIDIYNVFDITPIFGQLDPGQSEKMEFAFYAKSEKAFSVNATCFVEGKTKKICRSNNFQGGPQYDFTIRGESSAIQYRIEKRIIEFGLLPFQSTGLKEFTIFNTGKVHFSYKVNAESCANLIRVSPSGGSVASGGQHKVNVSLTPHLPERIEGNFFVLVDHCEPDSLIFFADAVFHHIVVSLPRIPDDLFNQYLSQIKRGKLPRTSELIGAPSAVSAASKRPGSGKALSIMSDSATITVSRDMNQQQIKWEQEAERLLIIHQIESNVYPLKRYKAS